MGKNKSKKRKNAQDERNRGGGSHGSNSENFLRKYSALQIEVRG